MQLANRGDLVALAFRACGKTLAPCHSERSEVRFRDPDGVHRTPEIGESRQLQFQRTTEILPSLRSGPPPAPQDDSPLGFSAACLGQQLPT
jgi:hypothetical protein